MKMVVIGSDHAGFKLKEDLINYLSELQYKVVDLGSKNEMSVDYPDFGSAVGRYVDLNENSIGIVICGSGTGITIAANKVRGIRAANCYNEEIAKLARQHNDANVLGLGARFISTEEAKKITKVFLETEFEGGRHEQRVDKLNGKKFKEIKKRFNVDFIERSQVVKEKKSKTKEIFVSSNSVSFPKLRKRFRQK